MDNPTMTEPERETFTQEQMLAALSDLETRFERMPGMPWFLMYPSCENAYNNTFLDPPLSIGINKLEITPERLSIFKTYFPDMELTDRGLFGKVLGVPSVITFIFNEYPYFKYPQTKHYEYAYYKLPNPIEDYIKEWKSVR